MDKIVQTAGRTALGEYAPQFAHFNDDVLFGENWNNQDIDVKTRSIITVVSLMSMGITDSSLKFHLQNATALTIIFNFLEIFKSFHILCTDFKIHFCIALHMFRISCLWKCNCSKL